jgi:hypothetical protein
MRLIKEKAIVTIVCKNCNKEFIVPRYRKNKAKYCSVICNLSVQNKYNLGKIPWNKGKKYHASNWINIVCKGCNKSFEVNPYRGNEAKYCSRKCMAISYKSHIPWNKGLKGFMAGEKHYNYGKHWSKEIIEKMSKNRKGLTTKENHPNWKGGISSENELQRVRFRRTIQKQVFKRDNYTCQICGVRGKDMTVDHIQSWAEYVELRFCIDNCRTLCVKCHYKITYGKPMPPEVRTWGHNMKNLKGGAKLYV